MKILDMTAGNRAIWFNKNYRDAIYVDIRREVKPTIVADLCKLPKSCGRNFDLVVFDPPHKNNGLRGKMVINYGHFTAAQIERVLVGGAKEAHRVTKRNALMAFKWNDHSRSLSGVLRLMAPWWEPLFGHGVRAQQRNKSMTSWVLLRRNELE